MNKTNEGVEVLLVHKGEVVMEIEALVATTITKEENEPINNHEMSNNEISTRYHWF